MTDSVTTKLVHPTRWQSLAVLGIVHARIDLGGADV
jgi:hypothetical protein